MTSETTTCQAALAFTVADMACDHGLRAIDASIARAVPGADVEADLTTKRTSCGERGCSHRIGGHRRGRLFAGACERLRPLSRPRRPSPFPEAA